MLFQILSNDGAPLNAHFELSGRTITYHARGGAKGEAAINSDYGEGLRLLLRRLHAASRKVVGIWVDSSRVQSIPLEERSVFDVGDDDLTPEDAFTRISSQMRSVGQSQEHARKGGGNSTRKLRIDLDLEMPAADVGLTLGARRSSKDVRSSRRLPADAFDAITDEHVWSAVQKLQRGFEDHAFGPSTDYDLITDEGDRLPPKAVFGLAASEALGFPVLPEHFAGGAGTSCFRVLERCYRIVAKGELPASSELPVDPELRKWAEGHPRLVEHIRQERHAGLARAKKAAFRREHGRLYCEHCSVDPITIYGPALGEACIEVHHREVQVKDMTDGHESELGHLECLCANCHRVEHRRLANRLS